MSNVYITGMGSINALGLNCQEFSDSLKNGVNGIKRSSYFSKLSADVKVAAEIGEFKLSEYIKSKPIDKRLLEAVRPFRGSRTTMAIDTLIASVIQAYDMAKITCEDMELHSDRTSIVVAGSNLSQNRNDEIRNRYCNSKEYVTPNYAIQFFDTNYVGILSEIFKIKGEGMTVGNASASGNAALINAYRMIKSGVCDRCIVAAPIVDFSPYELQSFKNLGALGGDDYENNPEQACRPFDAAHNGFILGQGCGCIILESDRILGNNRSKALAQVLSGSIKLDGNRLSDARLDGEYSAMKNAVEYAGLKAEDIDYINAHGTSTPLGDNVELSAIKELFGADNNNLRVNSTKGMIGHCMFSAGLIEAIACVLQMNGNFVHGNANLSKPVAEDVRLVGNKAENYTIKYALNNSFGFGGINTSVVIKNVNI